MEEAIKLAGQYGFPALLCLVILYLQREDRRECKDDRSRMWTELVRLATFVNPKKEGKDCE